MNSRSKILQALRARDIEAVELPDLSLASVHYENPHQQFVSAVESVGGSVLSVSRQDGLSGTLAGLDVFAKASKICSLVDGVERANVNLDDVLDPHDLEDVDLAIVSAEFGVAENGALWVTDDAVRHRVLPFIAQHVVVVVGGGQILHNMHEAYQRIQFNQSGFGVFISGPSKTADIEQSLVIGAHGPRSLTVLLTDPSSQACGWTG